METGALAARQAQPGAVWLLLFRPPLPTVIEPLPALEVALPPLPDVEPPTSKFKPPSSPVLPPVPLPAEPLVVTPGTGAAHAPVVHAAPPGQTAPWQVSTQVPALQACPAGQVTVSQPLSTQCPLLAQTALPVQARH